MRRITRVERCFSKKVPRLDNMRKGWNQFAVEYGEKIEKHTFVSQVTAANFTDLGQKEAVLDMACGTGIFGSYLSMSKPKNQKLYLMDLSDKMIEITKRRVSESLRTGSLQLDIRNILDAEIDEELIASNNIEIVQTDASDIAFLESGSLDVYISGLSLHLVPSPETVFKEAERVLKPGGSICFSVFGDAKANNYFHIFDSKMEEEGVMNFRSKFHMNDVNKVEAMLANSGFTHVRHFRQEIPFCDDYVRNIDAVFNTPANRAMIAKLPEDRARDVKQEIRDETDKILADQLIGLENLVYIARKI